MKNTGKVTCRPCKEQNNWEIESPDGEVLSKHYASKEECIRAAERYATECGCDLCVCHHKQNEEDEEY